MCARVQSNRSNFAAAGNYPSDPGTPDPILSPREQVHSEFLFGHNMFSPETHRKMQTACDWEAAKKGDKPSAACKVRFKVYIMSI